MNDHKRANLNFISAEIKNPKHFNAPSNAHLEHTCDIRDKPLLATRPCFEKSKKHFTTTNLKFDEIFATNSEKIR